MPASLAAVGERGVGDGRAKEEGVALEPISDTSIADRRSVSAAQFDDEVALADALDAAVGVAAPVVGVLGPERGSEGAAQTVHGQDLKEAVAICRQRSVLRVRLSTEPRPVGWRSQRV